MVILGGLELVVGGIIIHHYHKKNKRQRRRRRHQDADSDDDQDYERETDLSRHNSYPGPTPQPSYPRNPHPQPVPLPPQQKHTYAYRAPPQSLLQQRHQQVQARMQQCPRRRPVPRWAPGPGLQYAPPVEPLRRQDSFATMQDVPVANGLRYTGDSGREPLRTQPSGRRRPGQSLYGNAGFSQSVPAFEGSGMTVGQTGTSELSGRERRRGEGTREGRAPPLAITGTTRYEEEDDPPPPYEP